MRNKFLFFSPSPRDIPEVKQSIEQMLYHQHDVIWLKYYNELDAYHKARSYFLNSPEKYDYLCIIPDDLVINQEGLNQLFRELDNPTINLPEECKGNYPVLAGICNYSYINDKQMQMVPASISSTTSSYLLTFRDLDSMEDRIIKCAYIGFSCEFIHRSVLEKIDFKRYPDLGLDNALSDSLIKNKIPQYIVKTARFVHLKGLSVKHGGSLSVNPDITYQGVYKPYVVFVPRSK